MSGQAPKAGIQRDWQQKLTGCQYAFAGIDNITDPSNLDISQGKVVDGFNAYFDNTNSAKRRAGYILRQPGKYHSGWNNDLKTIAYMIKDEFIYAFDGSTPYVVAAITMGHLRMEFCQVNNVVAYSNTVDFGIIGGSNTQQGIYSQLYKRPVLGGRTLEFYNGRLYFSRGNNLYCTDTFDVEHVDVRHARVATFPHTITMCRRVEDGLVVGTEKFIYFLSGNDILDAGFEQITIAQAGVIYGTSCRINAEYVPESQARDTLVIFLSTAGICTAAPGGHYVNHSFKEVSFDIGSEGTALVRNERGVVLYTVCFDLDSSFDYNPYKYSIALDINQLAT